MNIFIPKNVHQTDNADQINVHADPLNVKMSSGLIVFRDINLFIHILNINNGQFYHPTIAVKCFAAESNTVFLVDMDDNIAAISFDFRGNYEQKKLISTGLSQIKEIYYSHGEKLFLLKNGQIYSIVSLDYYINVNSVDGKLKPKLIELPHGASAQRIIKGPSSIIIHSLDNNYYLYEEKRLTKMFDHIDHQNIAHIVSYLGIYHIAITKDNKFYFKKFIGEEEHNISICVKNIFIRHSALTQDVCAYLTSGSHIYALKFGSMSESILRLNKSSTLDPIDYVFSSDTNIDLAICNMDFLFVMTVDGIPYLLDINNNYAHHELTNLISKEIKFISKTQPTKSARSYISVK